jgi:hypothetical protein
MNVEIIIFMAFGMLQICFHNVHLIKGLSFMKKISEHHWVVWIFHPVVAHTFQDYFIHFVIYSGRVISGH